MSNYEQYQEFCKNNALDICIRLNLKYSAMNAEAKLVLFYNHMDAEVFKSLLPDWTANYLVNQK